MTSTGREELGQPIEEEGSYVIANYREIGAAGVYAPCFQEDRVGDPWIEVFFRIKGGRQADEHLAVVYSPKEDLGSLRHRLPTEGETRDCRTDTTVFVEQAELLQTPKRMAIRTILPFIGLNGINYVAPSRKRSGEIKDNLPLRTSSFGRKRTGKYVLLSARALSIGVAGNCGVEIA